MAMNDSLLIQELIHYHRFFETSLRKDILKFGECRHLNYNATLIYEHQFVKWFVIILDGQIRVWQRNQEREISLYYLEKFETCAYSVVALEKQYQSLVNASVASKKITILKIPISKVKEWKQYPSWVRFINLTLTNKYEILLKSIQALAFKNIDRQLMFILKQFAKRSHSNSLSISHKKLANEIGTSREVISRKLKDLERKNWLKLGYKNIVLKK